ncbi:hypothetical protein IC620_07410 [Hazenella sp. IB182357]|uniref:Uncharacterized protein n=1 Tax=Polycladospora coralii TaxID=2771432 RepID=A0A926NEQ6_9BACL|nr:hypothetical protein [Polycladospora coralii]MBD1372189.1 hypothetical protein [Polycladospora coralii]MBS7530688.1 hypothetical protein [Polycladospora coralii]
MMEYWVLWGIALYLVMFFLFKTLSRYFGKYYHNKAVHLVVLVENSGHAIEWTIRSYHFWNHARGRKGTITCIDTGSVDDTLDILKRLQQRYDNLEIIQFHNHVNADDAIQGWLTAQELKEKWIVLDLRKGESKKRKEKDSA